MGLSNEERISGLYYAVEKMVEYGDRLDEKRKGYISGDYDKLIGLIGQLWHAFIGKNSNGLHWIMGSSASNEVTWETRSPWGLAINKHCDGVLKEESDFLKGRRKSPDHHFFDVFDGFLNIPGLLGQNHLCYSYVFDIYGWSEQAIYYLRRYDDELLKDHDNLSRVISNIQGECFKLFKNDSVYARAYVLSTVCKILYGDFYPYNREKWDVVTKYFIEECAHHYLSRIMQPGEQDLKTVAGLHVKLHKAQKEKKLTKMMRLEAFLTLSGHKFNYDHQFKKLSEMLKTDGFKEAEIEKLHKLFIQCQKAHEDEKKRSQEDYEQNRMSPLSIYGTQFI